MCVSRTVTIKFPARTKINCPRGQCPPFRDRPWFPVKAGALDRAQGWYQRYGKWSLLLSWAPVIGDPLTIVAGVLREPLPVFLLLVTIAKVGRYIVVMLIAQSFV